MDLTVCTYNVHLGDGPVDEDTGQRDWTVFRGFDFVGFQECWTDQWHADAKVAFGDHYYAPRGAIRGNALVWGGTWKPRPGSLKGVRVHRGKRKVSPDRGWTEGIFDRDSDSVAVIVTHFVSGVRGVGKEPVAWRRRMWRRHLERLAKRVLELREQADHVVVMGDFNHRGDRIHLPGLKRHTRVGVIDHVFATPALHSLGVITLAARGSDHQPVVATLTTRPVVPPTPPKPDPEDTVKRLPANLPALLRAEGLRVVEVGGWQERGRPASTGSFAPVGVLWHHTGSYDSLTDAHDDLTYASWLAKVGRSDLPAPLCHLSISAEGTVFVCAAGRANHAGKARASGTVAAGDGNRLYVGVECMNSGKQGWPRPQYDAMVKTGVVLARLLGTSVQAQRAHRETSVTGKWDPGMLDMDKFRSDIDAALRNERDDDPTMPPAEDRAAELIAASAKGVERPKVRALIAAAAALVKAGKVKP